VVVLVAGTDVEVEEAVFLRSWAALARWMMYQIERPKRRMKKVPPMPMPAPWGPDSIV
jgi:hypothetical protein